MSEVKCHHKIDTYATTSISKHRKQGDGKGVNNDGYRYRAAMDRKGAAFTGPEGKGPCDQVGFAGMGNMSVSTPDRFSPDCGKMVMARLVLDGKTIFDELNAKDIQAKAEQKKKLDDERNKGTKPQI